MKLKTAKLIGLGLALISAMFLLSSQTSAKSLPPPAVQPQAVAAPAAVTRTFDLCAAESSVTMPDSSPPITIWGFGELAGGCTVGLPGPVLEADVGDTVVINVLNNLPAGNDLSLVFPGQDVMPDNTGVAPGGTASYTFVVTEPGTFLYESGVDYVHQIPMGLYGALVVHPAATGQAYNNATSAYDSEQVLVLSELDPNLNADPAGFNMLDYAPTYWLINGKAYDQTDNIVAGAGERVLLRYVNAGLTNHTMTMLGMHQDIVARDAFELPDPVSIVAETIPSGQTLDTVATVPVGASVGDTFAVYNRQLHITNGPSFPGGMLTFIEVGVGTASGPTALDFNTVTLASYAGAQDNACGSGATIEDGGATLHISGNCWKQMDFLYNVTANTILEFDFMSTVEAEIQGVGFDTDSTFNNPISLFQVFGAQNWGIPDYNNYNLGDGWKHYVIPVGSYYTGSMTLLTFANDDDAAPIGDSFFRNVTVYEGTPPPPPMLTVNGNSYPIESYGGAQDANPTVTIEDGGATLRIVGNGWKKISLPYAVTATTVLEFDFASSAEGEIHGIGFDTDDTINNPIQIFQLYGTQTYGPYQLFNNYGGPGIVHYVIPVGTYYTGNFLSLTFTNDHDVTSPTAESVFSNISIQN